MSEGAPDLPEELRARVKAEMSSVRPLSSPWRRLLYVSPIALATLIMPFVYHRLRDTSELGALLSWVPIAVQVLLASTLLMYALREGIPCWRVSRRDIMLLVGSAYALQILVNTLIFLRIPVSGGGISAIDMWFACFRVESLIGLPILLLIIWMVGRAAPQRPLLAGFLAGTGAGIAAEASWRMFCPYSDPGHVLLGHTGGILVLGLTGFLIGYLLMRARNPRPAGDPS